MNISQGIVLDHLPHWGGPVLLDLLELKGRRAGLLLGQSSHRLGKKDILIVAEYELSEFAEQKLAILAPDSTLNFVEQGKVVRKKRPQLPRLLKELVVCVNPKCITRVEEVPPKILSGEPRAGEFQCYYCQHSFSGQEVQFV